MRRGTSGQTFALRQRPVRQTQRRAIRTGIVGSQQIEVLSGLAAGDQVVVSAPADLKTGQTVTGQP